MGTLKKDATTKNLTKNPAGHLVRCGGNPCAPDPEMLLTVTGAAGTITWCGETWVLPGDSGVEKSVCPTTYGKQRGTNTTIQYYSYISGTWQATHWWNHLGSLSMKRQAVTFKYNTSPSLGGSVLGYRRPGFGYGPLGNYNRLQVKDGGVFTAIDYNWFFGAVTPVSVRPVATTYNAYLSGTLYTNSIALIMNIVAPEQAANSYELIDGFFGSHTNAGITYSWAKGAGW